MRSNASHTLKHVIAALLLAIASSFRVAPVWSAEADALKPVRIAKPVNGHIHPSACVSTKGTIVVTYGHINHRDLRTTRSSDGGFTW